MHVQYTYGCCHPCFNSILAFVNFKNKIMFSWWKYTIQNTVKIHNDQRDKTIADKLMYFPNDDIQNYPFVDYN